MRNIVVLSFLSAALAVGCNSTSARADEPVGKGTVRGKVVYPDGTPGVGVTVQLMARERAKPADDAPAPQAGKGGKGKVRVKAASVAEAIADSKGEFVMADVPAGRYVVACRLKGVGNARQPVSVSADGTADVSLKLVARSETKKPGKAKKPGAPRKPRSPANQ